jgi:hypothetical protein
MTEQVIAYDHYLMVRGTDGKRRKMPCRVVSSEMRQGWNQPHEVCLVEYRLGDGGPVLGTVERWHLMPLAAK